MPIDSFLLDTRRMQDGEVWRHPLWDAVPEREQTHLALHAGEIGRYALLPGDPDRCAPIAEYLDSPRLVAKRREFTTYTGHLLGEQVTVTSTGIGCPSAAIAVEELAAAGADTFVRVGTSAAIQPSCARGDLVVATAAVRDEGTTSHYVPIEFPAVADAEVTWALREGARRTGVRYHAGIVSSKDAFYGQRAYYRLPTEDQLKFRWQAWLRAGVLCTEMEAAAIFVVSSILRKRAGGIMLVATNQATEPEDQDPAKRTPLSKQSVIRASIEGLKVLIEHDRKARQEQEVAQLEPARPF